LENANVQIEITRKLVEEYREQIIQILKLTEVRTGGGGNYDDKEEQGNVIAHFSREVRK
jgi:hypothetical protein